MANFLIPTAIGLGANLLLTLLAPSGPRQQKGKIEDTGVPDAEFGFSLSLPFGRVRKKGLPMMWALKLKERRKVSGGKGGGTQIETFSYFLTAAYPIAREISSVRRVWMNRILVYSSESDDPRSERFLEHCTIYTGDQTTPSSVIQENEPDYPIPVFKGWSYMAFDDYPIAEYEGSGFPQIEVEVVGQSGENPKVKDILTQVCEIAGIAENKIDVSGVPDDLEIEGFDLLFEGTSFADQIGELLRAFFLIVRETKDKLVFKQQTAGEVTYIPKLSLGAKKFGDRPIDLYEIKLTHFREIPSAVTVNGLNVNKDQDAISVVAKDPAAKHTNELTIQTKLISSDNLFITLASRILFLGRSQSKTFSKMFLLPSWDDLAVGDLISADGDRLFHREVLQITKKIRGAGYLIELEATRFQGFSNQCKHIAVYDLGVYNAPVPPQFGEWITRIQQGTVFSPIVFYRSPMRVETTLPLGQISPLPNTKLRIYDADDNLIFTQNTAHGLTADSTWSQVTDCTGIDQLTSDILPEIIVDLPFAPPVETPASYGSATAIVIECPPVNSSDADLGFYLAIEGDEDYRTGTIFYSEDGGESYLFATAITGESVTGTVLSFSTNFNNSSPNFIDDLNTVQVRMDSGEIEPVTLEKFLSGKQLGWFSTGEIIAFKNAEIVSNNPLTFDISYMIRGTKGTEAFIDNHAIGERFVLLTDYLVRLPAELFDVNREVRFKIVPDGLTETEVANETIHTVTLESVKPFPAVVTSERVGGDVIISWYRRTRINGRWTDYIDIPFAPGELDTYTVRIYDGSTIRREFVTGVGERSVTYTSAQQIADWGSVQSAYTVRVFQNSSYPVAFKEALGVSV